MPENPIDLTEIQTEEVTCKAVMNPQRIERANNDDDEYSGARLALPSNEDIVEALSLLSTVVMQLADEIGFEQHYLYAK